MMLFAMHSVANSRGCLLLQMATSLGTLALASSAAPASCRHQSLGTLPSFVWHGEDTSGRSTGACAAHIPDTGHRTRMPPLEPQPPGLCGCHSGPTAAVLGMTVHGFLHRLAKGRGLPFLNGWPPSLLIRASRKLQCLLFNVRNSKHYSKMCMKKYHPSPCAPLPLTATLNACESIQHFLCRHRSQSVPVKGQATAMASLQLPRVRCLTQRVAKPSANSCNPT
nr:uncharacterized protein LOC105860175 [Microcebus murinus]